MAPPTKTGNRPAGAAGGDGGRAPRPDADGAGPEDPERANATVARARNPLTERSRGARSPAAEPDAEYRTGSHYGAGEPASDYHTGQSYRPRDDEGESLSGASSLEGDGLDALDPEVGPRTRAVAAVAAVDPDAPAADDVDDDAAGEAAADDDADATRAGPPIKLEIVAGPDVGKQRRFKGVRMTVGRTPGVDFQLSDQSVSRRHIELIHGDDGVVMRDLGSGNGTRVNGARAAERKLEHGDEITIGKTTLRFVDEVAAFRKAREAAAQQEASGERSAEASPDGAEQAETEAGGEGATSETASGTDDAADGDAGTAEAAPGAVDPKRPRTRVRTRARTAAAPTGLRGRWHAVHPKARLAVVFALGFAFMLVVIGVAARPPATPPVDPAKAQADQKMQQARNAARDGDYAAAMELVEAAERLVPGIDKTHLGTTARDELASVRAIEEGRGHLEARRFEDARKALAKVEKGSEKTQALKAKLAAELEVAEVAYKKEKLQEFLTAGEVDAAKVLLAELPVEEQAGPAEAIHEFEANLAEQQAQDAVEARRSAANAAAARKARREEEIAEAFRVVERKFAGGEWDRAASECARVIDAYPDDKDIARRARQLMSDIPNFGRNYEEGLKKFKQGALAQASRPLRSAWGLYKQLALRANTYGEQLKEKLGASSVAAGREALLRNDLAGAYVNFKDAVAFDVSDSKARDGLDQVQARAEDLFQEAYVLRDRDPREALRKFKIVAQVTDPGSTVHEKARNQIAAMQP
jgi:pSer/pThr/pTyr-binding forkhead associated (FHA) protein